MNHRDSLRDRLTGTSHIPMEDWLRLQVEAVPSFERSDGAYSSHCAAVAVRWKLESACQLNMISVDAANRLQRLLEERMKGVM